MDSKPPPFATASSEESRAYFDRATSISSHYCVILNFPEANGIGSGTLVSIAGKFGILTAHHVSELLQRTNDRFMICLGDTPTSLTVFKPQYRNIVVGQHRKTLEHLGPDLSFIQIIDPKLLSTLKAKKSFHPLDENVVPAFNSEQLKEMVWIVSGAPHVLTQKGALAGRPLTTYTLSHMAVQYHSTRHRKGFDYIRLKTTHGTDGYPKKYGGVSGGGIWVVGLSPENNEPEAILQGVVFYHYRPSTKSTESYLVAHGMNSIYRTLSESLSHNIKTLETPPPTSKKVTKMARPTRREMTELSEPEARKHCGPIFFTRSLKRASKEDIITNGSFGLVDTGTKKLLVTCNHVWEGFDEEHFKDPNVKMCVCLDSKNPVYLDEKHLIDRDEQADLATFDMTELLPACGGLKFFDIRSKPPPAVKRDDVIFLIGFPGHGRNAAGDFISFNRNPLGMIVSSVDDNRFHASVENIPWEPDKYGGISGCPAFLISAGRANELQLAGFAKRVGMNLLEFTHAGQLLTDGTIKR